MSRGSCTRPSAFTCRRKSWRRAASRDCGRRWAAEPSSTWDVTVSAFAAGWWDRSPARCRPAPSTIRAVWTCSFVGTLHFPTDVLATVEAGFVTALRQTYAIVGTRGAIEMPHDAFIPWDRDAVFSLRGLEDEQETEHIIPGEDEYQLMVEHFADVVRGSCAAGPPSTRRAWRTCGSWMRSRSRRAPDIPCRSNED